MTPETMDKSNSLMLKIVYLVVSTILFYLFSFISLSPYITLPLLLGGALFLFTSKNTSNTIKEEVDSLPLGDDLEVVKEKLDACIVREGLFQLLLEKLQTGLLIFSNNTLIYTNNYTGELLSRPVVDLINKTDSEIFTGELTSIVENSENDEHYFQSPLNEKSLFKIKKTPLSDDSFAYIITEKEYEKKHVDIKKHKLEVLGQLANGVAHDFNNTLTGILGAVDLLDDDLDSSKGELVSLIKESASRATDLTHKILNFSQKEYVESSNFNIHEVILSTISILERTINKKIKISHNLSASAFTVEGSIPIFQNMLLNMSLNSEAAMPDGGELIFSTKVTSFSKKECFAEGLSLKPGTYIQLQIKDTGEGIAEKNIEKIFDPFYTSRDRSKSIGLGLTNAYKDVTAMGGQIEVSSTPNVETVFTISLPITISSEKRTEVPMRATQGKTLLIVDDEKVIRLTAKAILENAGFTVLLAENGLEAISLYKENPIDLVLMDMIMPEMDGRECLKELQKIKEDVKVILVTGFVREKDVLTMKQNGLLDVVTKPFDPKLLTQKITSALVN